MFDVHVTVHCDKFLIIKPTRWTNVSIFSRNEALCVSDSSLSIIRSFSPYTQQWYMSCRFADSLQARSEWNWAVRKPVWRIPLLCIQWKTPDDGHRNCPKHVEFFFIVVSCCMLFQSLLYCSNSCTSLHFKILKSQAKHLKFAPTCFGKFLCPSSGVFHCTHSNGIWHTSLLTACEQDQDVSSWSCFQTCQQTCMT
jgi:modification target Cys-rich repeat protein